MDDEVEILADSVSEREIRITTFRLRYPRAAVHEDVMTHRDLSRNASSSRATPVKAMLARADWVPESFGRNKRGMGRDADLHEVGQQVARECWANAREACVLAVEMMAELGVAKEDANLLLRPFEWIDVVVTATRWRNFLAQRSSESTGQVRRQVKRVADGIRDLLLSESPTYLEPGLWHLPYVTRDELLEICTNPGLRLTAAAASAMRCARISIARLGEPGVRPTMAEDALSCEDKLVRAGHWSPLEHPCRAIARDAVVEDPNQNVDGWCQLRKLYQQEYVR